MKVFWAGVPAIIALLLLRCFLINTVPAPADSSSAGMLIDKGLLLAALSISSILLFSWLRRKKAEAASSGGSSVLDKNAGACASNSSCAETPKKQSGGVAGLEDLRPQSRRPASAKPEALRRFKKLCLVCNREFPEGFPGKCPQDGVELSLIADNLAAGTRFSEYYEIIAPLGTGGFSRVFLAGHISSRRQFALKLLHSHLCSNKSSLQRFQREANALSQLSHPNLVKVEDFKISPEGIPFIVMEYLEGESLGQVLKREGRLKWQQAVEMFLQICKGLSHAHSRGIIHRDLKPGNIMLVLQGSRTVAKVVDFGLVKADDLDSLGRITETGEVFGNPLYMSPEQCRGGAVDRRSDVYALACLLYECICGKPPFAGKNASETFSLHLEAPVPEIPAELSVPPWLVDTIKKALKKDPGERQQSVDDFGGELQDGLSSQRRG